MTQAAQGAGQGQSREYDLVVIGGGPGGYVAAIRAGQLGLKTACIDKEKKFGGTCLRVGCIPSKALLDASERYYHAKNGFAGMGITFEKLGLDVPAMMARKNKVDAINGTAAFKGPHELVVTGEGGKTQTLRAKHVLIATGSAPVELPFMKFDGQRIISSDQGIALTQVPKDLVVIGAGAIGLELGSVWSRLGAKVTVLEMLPHIVAGADVEMADALEKVLRKQGLDFFLEAKVTGAAHEADGRITVRYDWQGKPERLTADVVLVAVGRRPYAEGLGAREIGVSFDAKGRIAVDGYFRTSVPGVYAIGDVIAGPMLAHKAEEEGIACVETIAGKHGHVNYNVIPAVVYTSPELAWVGQTEEQARANGLEVAVGKFRFANNGRALAMDEPEGFVKVLADARTDKLLGVHILAAQASSMIPEAASVMEFGGSAEDIARTCHAHPTLPEAVKEAAMAVAKRAIHG